MRYYPFGDRLRELRRSKDFTQDDLAALLGVTRGQIGHWETGTRGLSVADATRLARALNVSLTELIPVDERGLFVEPQDVIKEVPTL